MRFGWVAYIVPFLFVYSPAIPLKGSVTDIVIVKVTSLAGIWLICAAMTGYAIRVIRIPRRTAFFAAGVLLMLPHQVSEAVLWMNIAGAAIMVRLFAAGRSRRRDRAIQLAARDKANLWARPAR